MNTVKESLHHAIEGLDDEKAQQILSFTQRLQSKEGISPTLKRLVDDPAFNVPLEEMGAFRAVQPIQGKGIPASRLLVDDRR